MSVSFMSLLFALILFSSLGCATRDELSNEQNDSCRKLADGIDWDNEIATLNTISKLFNARCYSSTIVIGSEARARYRHKNYNILREAMELFLPEGAVTDYVMESYERGYLSFMIGLSYLKLNKGKEVPVELNRLYQEETADIYNHGEDPVNTLLQAVMWDKYPMHGFSSRPFWLKLTENKRIDPSWRKFAMRRLNAIDAKQPTPQWHIARIGKFPELDWSIDLFNGKSGYFRIAPKTAFVETCADSSSLLVPTSSWLGKIAIRHAQSYHPLVNAKTWIRLPVGIFYGVSTVAAGAAIVVGGCGIDIKTNSHLCDLSIKSGVAVMAKSGDVTEFVLEPDLRHWENVPSAILITTDREQSSCQSVLAEKAVPIL